MGKVINRSEIEDLSKKLKSEGKKIVTTNGCFDILHVGHVRYLKQAKSYGDMLILGLNSDSSVRKLKGPKRPINNQDDRAEVMAALGFIDYVVVFDEDTPVNLLSQIKPDVHVKGGDYDINNLPEAKTVMAAGGRVEFVSFVEGKSTTNIIEKSKV